MYHAITWLFGLAARIFYRWSHLGGQVPDDGPVLLVANHPNSLMDPVIISMLTRRPVRWLAKAPIFKMPVLKWVARGTRALPVYRAKDGHDTSQNEEMFRAVHDALAAGEVVALFPEGISHDGADLAPLKTGAARIALGATAAGSPVRIVPMGLGFEQKPVFRSVATSLIGRGFDVSSHMELYRADPKSASIALTGDIEASLRAVTLHAPDDDDLPLLRLAAAIYGGPDDAREVLGDVADAAHKLRQADPAHYETLKERLGVLYDALHQRGLGYEHALTAYRPSLIAGYLVRHAFASVCGLPVALAGLVGYGVPFFFLRLLPVLMRSATDLHATVRMLGGLVVFPLYQVALTVLLFVFLDVSIAFPIAVALPFVGLYAHHYFRRRRRMWHDGGAFFKLMRAPGAQQEIVRSADALRRAFERVPDKLAASTRSAL